MQLICYKEKPIRLNIKMLYLLSSLVGHGSLEGLQSMLRCWGGGEHRLSCLLDPSRHHVSHVNITGFEEAQQLLGWLQNRKLSGLRRAELQLQFKKVSHAQAWDKAGVVAVCTHHKRREKHD